MKKVFVCAGMSLAKNENINQQATKLGAMLAQANCIYAQGGSDQGLMGLTLKEFAKHSHKVELYIPEKYYPYDFPKLVETLGADNFVAVKIKTEAERLEKIKRCDEIIVLPGGTGTLEELLFCNETSRSQEHKNHITLVNIDGFFNGFLNQVEKNVQEGLSKPTAIKFDVVNNINEIEFFSKIK